MINGLLHGPLDIITQTPPADTYQNGTVITWANAFLAVVDLALASLIVIGGLGRERRDGRATEKEVNGEKCGGLHRLLYMTAVRCIRLQVSAFGQYELPPPLWNSES